MENAQLISLSRQMALARQMDVVANNVANINTTGFKAESLLFEDYIMPVADYSAAATPGDEQLHYTDDWATVHNFQPGAIQQTGNALDVALEGPGFFVVQTPAGERYTRDGSFKINNSGLLVDDQGNTVLSEGGEIRFTDSETDIHFNPDGSIVTSAGNKGTLRVAEFDEPRALVHQGDNLFSSDQQPLAASRTTLIPGALERSNVSGVSEIANMIRVQRAYETISSLLDRQNQLRETAIRDLASLNG
ncbi:MAG: flagellar basal-body rod protein FlgF [Hyphomicrobiaceae bacterium]|nr:flagellar basal-body rod protein FlgF [Hyphomicrobiaceae bacterium]